MCGRVAQRIRHLTTNQGIAGSNPAVVVTLFSFSHLDDMRNDSKISIPNTSKHSSEFGLLSNFRA